MIRIIKVGGRAQGDPALITAIVTAARSGDSVCVVHGGGDEVSALQRRLGLEPAFIGGRRVTTPADLEVVRMVLSGTINKRIVAQLISAGVPAVGISGEDGGLFHAAVTDPQMGRVGGAVRADASLVKHLMAAGFVPVVSPVAREDDAEAPGGALNVNGDDAAAALAAAVGADDLVLVADVPGVLDEGQVVRRVDADAVAVLIRRGVITGGMAAKLEAAAIAASGGVKQVRIAGVSGVLDVSAGTRFQSSPSPVR